MRITHSVAETTPAIAARATMTEVNCILMFEVDCLVE